MSTTIYSLCLQQVTGFDSPVFGLCLSLYRIESGSNRSQSIILRALDWLEAMDEASRPASSRSCCFVNRGYTIQASREPDLWPEARQPAVCTQPLPVLRLATMVLAMMSMTHPSDEVWPSIILMMTVHLMPATHDARAALEPRVVIALISQPVLRLRDQPSVFLNSHETSMTHCRGGCQRDCTEYNRAPACVVYSV